MPISRARKEELVAQYVEILKDCDGMVIVQTQGLSVPQVEGMRAAVRECNGQYIVAKNTLIRNALEQANWVVPEDLLEGPVAIIFGRDNMPGVAKAVYRHMEDADFDEKMRVAGGIMSGELLDAGQVEAVSKLPTLDELRGQLAGLMMSPAQGIVNVLQQATGGVVNVLQAYVDKHEEGGA